MRTRRHLARVGSAAAVLATFLTLPAQAKLAVGDPAPAFALAGSDGRQYELAGLLKEHGGVVLAWFPKAFTPG